MLRTGRAACCDGESDSPSIDAVNRVYWRAMRATDGYAFRKATNADISAIGALISNVLAEYGILACVGRADRDLADIEANYWNAGGAFLVLLDGTTIIGTVALRRDANACCELCRMYLHASYRGRGLGRRLFERAVEEAMDGGAVEMRLETSAVLTEAIALYQANGFTLVDGKPMGCNCDLVMHKRLV